MKTSRRIRRYLLKPEKRVWYVGALGVAVLASILVYKLGSLVGGLSPNEMAVADAPHNWSLLWQQPLYLPLNLVRTIVFSIFPHHGQTLTRLPNALFGALTVGLFIWLISKWHSRRTAAMAGALFLTNAWVLHVSRLASFDVLYLWATVTLLAIIVTLQRNANRPWVVYSSIFALGLLLFVPGVVWLIIPTVWWQRKAFGHAWQNLNKIWQRILLVIDILIWIPLLVKGLLEQGVWKTWLGLPEHFATPMTLLKQLFAVPLHLFIRGPQYPEVWLGRAPILDIFCLAMVVLGLLFYLQRWKAGRSRVLIAFLVIGAILIGLGGPVSLSLLVPILYICAAAGITYMLHDWLKVFPVNPFARAIGYSLIGLAILMSGGYNLRAYFVAWPHNQVTEATFDQHRTR